VNRYKKLEKGAFVKQPMKVDGYKNIEIAKNVFIGYKAWLAALPLTGAKECSLQFGEGCSIGNFNHIYATQKIVFGKNVLTADKVYISDNLHQYEDISTPILQQPIKQLKEVYIGEGAWIGENACIIGACIGKQSVIGSNAVVTKNIPDYCIAVGSPAYIIKRYCFDTKKWRKTFPEGNFVE
jgi:acetyltransferase-like isoleucine patch superfamily enzyme